MRIFSTFFDVSRQDILNLKLHKVHVLNLQKENKSSCFYKEQILIEYYNTTRDSQKGKRMYTYTFLPRRKFSF